MSGQKHNQEQSLWQNRRKIIRPVLRLMIRVAFNQVADIQVNGKENIPLHGPYIIVGNHFSFLDPVILIEILPVPLEFVGGTELPGSPPIVRFIPRLWGTYQVHRGSVSRDALTGAEKVLSSGGIISIFPEGGSWATVLRPARPGAALLAVRSRAAILPIGLNGMTEVFPLKFRIKTQIQINIGKPFGPFMAEVRGREGRQILSEISETIMRKIAELIPADRHGYYSGDPAVRLATSDLHVYPRAEKSEK